MQTWMSPKQFIQQIQQAREIDRLYPWIQMVDWFLKHAVIGEDGVEFDDSLDTPMDVCYEAPNSPFKRSLH